MRATRDDVLKAYRELLGREPESEKVVQHWLSRGMTPEALHQAFLLSTEYERRLAIAAPAGPKRQAGPMARAKQANLPKLRYVAGVSWPRSGHHLLARLLTNYFGNRFNYCEYYNAKNCCQKMPCARQDQIALSKNHDFDLKTPVVEGTPYLIQYREFIPSVVSDFELHVRAGGEDTPASFVKFATTKADLYSKFMYKWVYSKQRPSDCLLVPYEKLTESTEDMLIEVLRFFSPKEIFDRGIIQTIRTKATGEFSTSERTQFVGGFGVKGTRNVEQFRHFDEDLFAELSAKVRDLLSAADSGTLPDKAPEKNV
jgi:hypothetical protein